MGHCFSHLSKADRYKIEALLRAHRPAREIAEIVHVHISTIYREIKRARTVFRNSDWTEEERYNPDLAEMIYRENLAAKGAGLKIANDLSFAKYIEHKIVDEKLSPAAALASISLEGMEFSTKICRVTLYNYIDKGIFLRLTNKCLPVKSKRKKRHRKVRAVKQPLRGESIENRPEEIASRETFGHWEGDTVYSGKKKAPSALFVFTERMTRKEIIIKKPDRTAASAVSALDDIQARYGDDFQRIFRSITFDNGSEFADVDGLERSATNAQEKRTKVYFCHPYSSFERGSNENNNRFIRRPYPKGTDFSRLSEQDILSLESWINNYPRQSLGWKTAEIRFRECVSEIV